MKSLIIVGLLGIAVGAAAVDIIGTLNFHKSIQVHWLSNTSHTITVDEVSFAEYTVPDGKSFSGSLNFSGITQ